MPKATTITCDECGADLTTTSNCEGYRLALVNERIPPQEGLVTAMAAYPIIENDAYFCCWGCLSAWATK